MLSLLELLDNKPINDVTRLFLKNFDKIKSEQRQKKSAIDVTCDANGVTNQIMDIDLRDNNQSMTATTVRSDSIVFDVTNIISQAIVENVQNKPWIMFGEYTFLTEYIGASPKPIHDQNEHDTN